MSSSETVPQTGGFYLTRRMGCALSIVGVGLTVAFSFHFVAAVIFLVFCVSVFAALHSFRQARRFADIPTARIRAAPQGYVEIVGRLGDTPEAGGLTPTGKAPISGESCAYWEVALTQPRKSSSGSRWVTVAEVRSHDVLLPIQDGTDTCYLMVQEAEIHAIERSHPVHHRDTIGALLGLSPAENEKVLAAGQLRAVERILPADAEIYAMGLFRSYPSNQNPMRENWATRKLAQRGSISGASAKVAEWAVIRSQAYREQAEALWWQLMRDLEGVGPEDPLDGTRTVHVLSSDTRPQNLRPLVISTESEHSLIRRYYIRAACLAVVSVLLGCVLAVVFLDVPLPPFLSRLFDAVVSRSVWKFPLCTSCAVSA